MSPSFRAGRRSAAATDASVAEVWRPDVTSLAPCDVAGRIDRLRALAFTAEPASVESSADSSAESGVDSTGAPVEALLVTRLVNVRYLTGFTGSAAMLLVTPHGALFVSDGRYGEQAELQLAAAGVTATIEISNQHQQRIVTDDVAGAGVRRLGLEAGGVTWAQQRSYATTWFPECELVATEGLVEGLRRRKDPGEIARIEAACAIADDALAACLGRLNDGPTERELGLDLEVAMRRRGASGTSFEPIIAAGPNGARPHARVSDRRIGPGELLILDFGCIVDGYCSDMTRTVSLGDPGPDASRLWQLVLDAQQAGVAAVRPGIETSALDAACRDVIEDAGWGERFTHGTGHGVGLEIHEAPRVGPRTRDTLAVDDIVTVEPGVYLPGVGGVRIEDSVVVTDDGCRILTRTPKVLCL